MDTLYTIREVAQLFEVSRGRVTQMMKAKKRPLIPSRTKPIMFSKSELVDFATSKSLVFKKYDRVLYKLV